VSLRTELSNNEFRPGLFLLRTNSSTGMASLKYKDRRVEREIISEYIKPQDRFHILETTTSVIPSNKLHADQIE